ncbi:MAG: hypothetical protein KF739_01935 [Cryobacterium sp.]|nr:hypothetical protein [Cryobacterium sp.]
MTEPLAQLRADFDAQAGRSVALPMAGAIVWAGVGIAALFVTPRISLFVLIIGTGAIFPLGLLLAAMLREKLFNTTNPLAKLMGMCVLMVNLLWAVHLTLLYVAPTLIPLTLGIGLGLHWIVFSWIIQHPTGTIHAIARTVLVTAAWWFFPEHQMSAVAAAVVVTYLYSILALRFRTLNTVTETTALSPAS